MVVMGILEIKNITDNEMFITSIRSKKPKFYGHFSIKSSNPDEKISVYESGHVLVPRQTTKMLFKFHITPSVKEKGETFITDIAVSDHYGNKHWIKNLEFEYNAKSDP